jgi:hypothetical protein
MYNRGIGRTRVTTILVTPWKGGQLKQRCTKTAHFPLHTPHHKITDIIIYTIVSSSIAFQQRLVERMRVDYGLTLYEYEGRVEFVAMNVLDGHDGTLVQRTYRRMK